MALDQWTMNDITTFNERFHLEIRQDIQRHAEELRPKSEQAPGETAAVRNFVLPGVTLTVNTDRNISVYDLTDTVTGKRYYFVQAFDKDRNKTRLAEIEAEAEANGIAYIFTPNAVHAVFDQAYQDMYT